MDQSGFGHLKALRPAHNVAQHRGNRVAHDQGNWVAQHSGNQVAHDGGNSTTGSPAVANVRIHEGGDGSSG